MIVQKILTEWTYRLPKGYPVEVRDYDVLREILDEMTDLPVAKKESIVRQAKGIREDGDNVDAGTSEVNDEIAVNIESKLAELQLPGNITQQILTIYSQLSIEERAEFDKNFRIHSIETFLSGGYKPFIKFYNIINTEKSTGDMGFGEIQVLLAVKNSMPGGTAQHDIIMPDGEWEVKQIGTSKSVNQLTFRPAKAGMPQQGDLLTQLREFYRDVVIPFASMGDPLRELQQLVDENSRDNLRKFLQILTDYFVPNIDRLSAGREISYVPLNNMYTAFKQLNNIFWQTDLDSDVQDTRLAIKSKNMTSTYWISDDDYEKIKNNAGTDDDVNVNIGSSIDDENKNIAIWFSRVKRSPMILTPDRFIAELNNIKSKLFTEISGLIVYQYQKPGYPIETTQSDWSIVSLSGGQWVFGLTRTFDSKYTFIHIQS
jgi:hypothetical protein